MKEVALDLSQKSLLLQMVEFVSLIRKILSSSNGCELMNYGYRFVNLRKYLCFQRFLEQRKFFYSTERTFSPKQTQNAPKKDTNLRLFKKEAKVGGSDFFTTCIYSHIRDLAFKSFLHLYIILQQSL